MRYPVDVQKKIDQGHKFKAFLNQPPLERPYLTRNGHLGHFASKANPHYFEADQLYDLKTDVGETKDLADRGSTSRSRLITHVP